MILMFLYIEPVLECAYGTKWEEAISIIKILSVSSIIYVLAGSNTSLIRALGYASLEFKIQLFKTLLLYIPSIIVGTYFYGIVGTAWSIVFNGIVSVIIAMYFMNKLLGFTYLDLFNSIYKTMIMIILIIISYYILPISNIFVNMGVSAIVMIASIFILQKRDIQKIIKR